MKNEEIIQQIQQKRLVFTVTTGRSGTAYLKEVFNYMKNVRSFHEPHPEFVTVLRQVQTEPDKARQFLLEEKLPAIAQDPAAIYVETSHLACNEVLEPVLEMNIVPDLILHRRPPRAVSLSLLKMGTIPGRTDKALRFYLSPDDPGVIALHSWQDMQDYQLCYWYCLEIERRARRYGQIFQKRGGRVVETTLDSLKTVGGLRHVMKELDLSLKFPALLHFFRFVRNSRFKVNESKITKKKVVVPDGLPELEKEVLERIDGKERETWLSGVIPGQG